MNHIDDSTLIGRYFQIKEVKRTSESLKLSVVEGVEGSSTSIKEVRDYRPSAFDMYVRIREPNIFYGTSDEDGSYFLRLQQMRINGIQIKLTLLSCTSKEQPDNGF